MNTSSMEEDAISEVAEIEIFADEEKQDGDISENGDEEEALSEDEFVVAKIVGRRQVPLGRNKFKTQYRIRWEGYGEDDDMWEDDEKLNCRDKIEEYNGSQETPEDEVDDDVVEEKVEKLYVVEKILDVRRRKGGRGGKKQLEYLIQWQDYPGENSWEANIEAPELLASFYAKRGTNFKNNKKATAVTSPEKKPTRRGYARMSTKTAQAPPPSQTPPLSAGHEESSTEGEEEAFEEWEVEKILARRQVGGKDGPLQYKIQWKGNDPLSGEPFAPSWELIKEFEEKRLKNLPKKKKETKKRGVVKTQSLSSSPRGVKKRGVVNGGRYPRRHHNNVLGGLKESRGLGGSEGLKELRGLGGSRGAVEKKNAKTHVSGRPNKKKSYSKDLEIYLMRKSEIVDVKKLKFDPNDVTNRNIFTFNQKDVTFENENVKVFARATFKGVGGVGDGEGGGVWYLVVQGKAKDLHFGVTEEFLKERYPLTFSNLEHSSLLQVKEQASDLQEDDEEME